MAAKKSYEYIEHELLKHVLSILLGIRHGSVVTVVVVAAARAVASIPWE